MGSPREHAGQWWDGSEGLVMREGGCWDEQGDVCLAGHGTTRQSIPQASHPTAPPPPMPPPLQQQTWGNKIK
jgi:hypothetical protein